MQCFDAIENRKKIPIEFGVFSLWRSLTFFFHIAFDECKVLV